MHSTYSPFHLSWATDFNVFMGRSAPLIVEIGYGGAHFLTDLALNHPASNVIGIEVSHFCTQDGETKRRKHLLENLLLIHGNAVTTLAYVFSSASVDRFYINFPDPFPKTSHAHRRLLAPYALSLITDRLKPGGLLTIATDVPAYAESIAHDLAHTAGLVNLHPSAWLSELPGRTPTRYERKAIEKGHPRHYFEWQRDHISRATPVIPVQESPHPYTSATLDSQLDTFMPNIVLTTPLTLTELSAAFTPQEFHEGAIHVRLLGHYLNPTQGLIIDTFIDEPLLEQRPAIVIVPRGSENGVSRYVVRLSLIGYPRPTQGAHVAVRQIAQWVARCHPDTRLLHVNAHGDEDEAQK
jgi:tRNA (guanine-N7-)-methyltransferase